MKTAILFILLLSNCFCFGLEFEDDVIYQIFPISFRDSDGDGRGDINGIAESIPYFESLGVTAVWLNPVFESHFYHGYQYSNFDAIDSDLGTEEDFWNLIDAFHENSIEIYIDLVIYGIFEDNEYFEDAYGNPDSDYDDWFLFTNLNNTEFLGYNNVGYDGYSGNFVHFNLNNEDLYEFLIET